LSRVVEQSVKFSEEQVRLRFQTTLLECQNEASIDGLLRILSGGTDPGGTWIIMAASAQPK
jgi:hypothetical protein